ncbi:class I SAM-dependent methyltransferase [Nocardia sp. XZ_19_385]|uniref:class I SAM-dependent methyltransferase n=1 Tax=Nocardia sp. XZ_19_385 TaxID=2769488 RepID=UPI001890460E|nr:class I SAM-dependent methyltransferase [Nocardia sp. XZ_19_385]
MKSSTGALSHLDAEYSDPTALQVRIDTHRRFSEKADDPQADVLAAINLTGTEYLADIGCGDARFLASLAAAGHQGPLVGVDTSATMVAAADVIPGVRGILADATRMPFDDNTFDVLTARHMLYHVPEPAAALAEFRRTTKPGGIVSVVVNRPKSCPRLRELITAHAATYGIDPADALPYTVNAETLPPLMNEAFGTATLLRRDNALVFDSPEPLIHFAASLFTFDGIAPDNPHRAAILTDLTADIEDWFTYHPGQAWRDPKGYLVATATIPD